MTVPDPEPHGNTDPDPGTTPGLERGGGVPPGTTPPESAGTSGLSAPEPETRKRFPVTGWMTLGAVIVIVLVFVAVIVGLIAAMM
ncbi:DUF6480 family protein [Rhodococcus sp. HM1]|uniref:DUF6480 family protein n=1 Tax=Rhodococcus sp. HM1 TaxID=2937759 RepID=UPI00200B832A|nr:DUF6480 family protein [Rhodococcus sp. HM1]MCK8669887.1 DUF6480 family protein [Rhodococcus sp. HM1]